MEITHTQQVTATLYNRIESPLFHPYLCLIYLGQKYISQPSYPFFLLQIIAADKNHHEGLKAENSNNLVQVEVFSSGIVGAMAR